MGSFSWLWEKYGLSYRRKIDSSGWPLPSYCRAHDVLCAYLMNHPDEEAKYLNNEPGFGYYEILNQAEKKYKIKLSGENLEYVTMDEEV